jgi:hypothetical protein
VTTIGQILSDVLFRLMEERDRYFSHATQARKNAADRYATIQQQRENLERAARYELRARELDEKIRAHSPHMAVRK